MQAETAEVAEYIRRSLANRSATVLRTGHMGPRFRYRNGPRPGLTLTDTQCIIQCLRENPRFSNLTIVHYDINNAPILNTLRNGLLQCTTVTAVHLVKVNLRFEALERLLPAFTNTSITTLHIDLSDLRPEQRDGVWVLRDLLIRNNSLLEFGLTTSHKLGLDGAMAIGQGLAGNNYRLQRLNLHWCSLYNEGLAKLLAATDGMINNSLTYLSLRGNSIEGSEGGRQVSLLLQRFPALAIFDLGENENLGPLGASALAPGLAAARNLKVISFYDCRLGNDGAVSFVPDGQVNMSLTRVNLWYNSIEGTLGGENVVALAARCTNLETLNVNDSTLSPDQQRRLDLLLERKPLCTEVQALAGSPLPVLFRAMEKAHRHEHGLSAILVILQNDGDDLFYNAFKNNHANRAAARPATHHSNNNNNGK